MFKNLISHYDFFPTPKVDSNAVSIYDNESQNGDMILEITEYDICFPQALKS